MGRAKHISPIERANIVRLREEGKSIRKIASETGISIKGVQNALNHVSNYHTVENVPRSARKRKSTAREDRMIHRLSEADRKKTAIDIQKEMKNALPEFKLSVRTIRKSI